MGFARKVLLSRLRERRGGVGEGEVGERLSEERFTRVLGFHRVQWMGTEKHPEEWVGVRKEDDTPQGHSSVAGGGQLVFRH